MAHNQIDPNNIHLIPPYWLNCPKMGYPIQIPERPNLFLIPMKTPLPKSSQQFFPVKYQWTMPLAAKKAAERLNTKRPNIIILNIELSQFGDLVSQDDCLACDITHIYMPIFENYEEVLQRFRICIMDLASPGYPTAILVSCHNGYNKTGFAIAGLLSTMENFTLKASTYIFSIKRPPGIFSSEIIEQLHKISPEDQKPKPSKPPNFIAPFPEYIPDELLSEIHIDDSPNFIYDGGIRVTDPQKILELTQFLHTSIPANGKFHRPVNGEISPYSFVWTNDRFAKFESESFRISFTPRGQNVFVIITQTDGFFVCYALSDFYFFPAKITFKNAMNPSQTNIINPMNVDAPNEANSNISGDMHDTNNNVSETNDINDRNNEITNEINHELNNGINNNMNNGTNTCANLIGHNLTHLPIICTGIYSSQYRKHVIFLTDVLVYGRFYMEISDLEERMRCLWHLVLSNIKESPIQLMYRPLTKIKYAMTLLRDFQFNQTFDGIPCDGVTLINHKYPVGSSLFVPLRPTLTLLVILNAPRLAVLYARADDNAQLYVPFSMYMSEVNAGAKLNRKIVKFEIMKNGQNYTVFKPIAICKNELCDLASYARSVITFIADEISGSEVVKELRQIVSKI